MPSAPAASTSATTPTMMSAAACVATSLKVMLQTSAINASARENASASAVVVLAVTAWPPKSNTSLALPSPAR